MLLDTLATPVLSDEGTFAIEHGISATLGVQLTSQGANFAVHAGEANHVELLLFDDDEQLIQSLVLPSKHASVHFGLVKGIKVGQLYGYRLHGPYKIEQGQRFDATKLLLDPYAKAINRPIVFNHKTYHDDNLRMLPKCKVVDETFDWQGIKRPNIALADTIIYETHVRGISQQHEQVDSEFRGSYLGLSQACVIKHLKQLGVTAVQLLPVASFMSEARLTELGLSNYWGYNPLLFMAPEPRYAQSDAVIEFKTMVRELHRQGIEVILDVVFNHSAEAGDDGPILCYRGLDNRSYYLFDHIGDHPNYRSYSNNTGCGNSLSFDSDVTLQLVLDALRYWHHDMQVDGFRFDLAASLGREHNRFRYNSAFFRALRQDPQLKEAKLIAEPWDIGWGGYQLGGFPPNWQECNDRYRDTLRGFWRGDHGLIAELATRLMGSRDIFPSSHRNINTSVNYICYHDGFTLHDLVSYEQRHNLANCENNRDGHGHNLSRNYGYEGTTDKPEIIALRQRQKRNLVLSLLLSQGMVHFLGGDELGRTQQGNNNAYCQNNAISWFNWQLDEQQSLFCQFVSQAIALRKSSPIWTRLQLDYDDYQRDGGERHHVYWYRETGRLMKRGDWHDPARQHIMVELRSSENFGERWLVLINASASTKWFFLPKAAIRHRWEVQADTFESLMQTKSVHTSWYMLSSYSMVVLKQISNKNSGHEKDTTAMA